MLPRLLPLCMLLMLLAPLPADIIVTGMGTDNLAVFDATGAFQTLVTIPATYGTPNAPCAIARAPGGDIFVAENSPGFMLHFDTNLTLLARWTCNYSPIYGMAIDAAGTIYITGSTPRTVRRFDSAGALLGDWSVPTGNMRDFHLLPGGDVLVSDFTWSIGNGVINHLDGSSGALITTYDGPGVDLPFGMTPGAGTDWWVVEQNSHLVHRFDASGVWQSSFQVVGASGQIRCLGSDSRGWLYIPCMGMDYVEVYDDNQVYQTRLVAPGLTDPTDVLVRDDGPSILLVDTAPTEVAPGQAGIAVTMDVTNTHGTEALDVNTAGLTFTGAADRTAEYTVTPDPGNPVSIAVGATVTFAFTVDVSTLATPELITLDGTIDTVTSVTAVPGSDTSADTPDSWEVVGARPMVRLVDAGPATVGQGSSGHQVHVDVENTGLLDLTVGTVTLTFTGTADRTSEYTVTPDPANPATIPVGVTGIFALSVAVDPAATTEVVTIDAGCSGTTTLSGLPVEDLDADVTDTWEVLQCAATVCGDCSGDGVVSILDALTAAQHSAGLIVLQGTRFTNCNVIGLVEPDPGAAVTILDALSIAQASAGLSVQLVCC